MGKRRITAGAKPAHLGSVPDAYGDCLPQGVMDVSFEELSTRVGDAFQATNIPSSDSEHAYGNSGTAVFVPGDEEVLASYLEQGLRFPFRGSAGAAEELLIEILHTCNYDDAAALKQFEKVLSACGRRVGRYPSVEARLSRRLSRIKDSASSANVTASANCRRSDLAAIEQRLNNREDLFDETISIGECIYLKTESALPHIALVERLGPSQTMTCRWFYRHSDLPPELRRTVCKDDFELFLSSHRDQNFISSVVGKCWVQTEAAKEDHGVREHFCRSLYDLKSRKLLSTHNWRESQRPNKSTPVVPNKPPRILMSFVNCTLPKQEADAPHRHGRSTESDMHVRCHVRRLPGKVLVSSSLRLTSRKLTHSQYHLASLSKKRRRRVLGPLGENTRL